MTTRERMYTALMGQMPDRVPFTTYRGVVTAEEGLDHLIAQGLGLMGSCRVYDAKHRNVKVTRQDETLDGIPTVSYTHLTLPTN